MGEVGALAAPGAGTDGAPLEEPSEHDRSHSLETPDFRSLATRYDKIVRNYSAMVAEGEDHPHMEITQAIIGAAIRIQSSLGSGLLEDAYKICLAHALRQDGHKVLREVYLDIDWEGLLVERGW